MKNEKTIAILKKTASLIAVVFWSFVLLVGVGNVLEAVTHNPAFNLSEINLYVIKSKSMASVDESNREFLADKKAGFLNVDDVVIVKKAENENLSSGDIVTYVNADGFIIVHRIYKIIGEGDKARYVTRGDANNVNDPDVLYKNDIKGVFLFSIPYIGEFASFVKSKYGIISLLSVAFVLFLFGYLREKEAEKFGPLYYAIIKNTGRI